MPLTGHIAILTDELGRYDVVGDVHGCRTELAGILRAAGWILVVRPGSGASPVDAHHPDGRMLLLTGDLVNKGPDPVGVLRLVMGMATRGRALSVRGNHDHHLLLALLGKEKPDTQTRATLQAIRAEGPTFVAEVRDFLATLPHQIRAPIRGRLATGTDGHMTVVHAAARTRHIDACSQKAVRTAVFGRPADGKGGRDSWCTKYHGKRLVVHGHATVTTACRRGHVISLDTGAAQGGFLTLLRVDTGDLFSLTDAGKIRPKRLRAVDGLLLARSTVPCLMHGAMAA